MKKKSICLAALLVMVAVCFALWPHTESQGIFYRVLGGKNDLYVLGSIHIGSKAMYPFGSSIRTAMQKADAMVFECDTQSEQALQDTRELMQYSAGDSLAEHISADTMSLLEKTARKLGYDFNALMDLKPWAITSMLSMETLAAAMNVKEVDQAVALGVENGVRGQCGKKETLYLETVIEQLGRMDGFSPALQDYLLADACSAVLSPKEDEELQHWPGWWAEGNAQAFADSYQRGQQEEKEPLLAQEYHHLLITQRNQLMAERLANLLETDEGKTYFATIGLMHLVLEEDSILSELERMGYTVEKIEN